jgi:hypothetical protein
LWGRILFHILCCHIHAWELDNIHSWDISIVVVIKVYSWDVGIVGIADEMSMSIGKIDCSG